MKIRKKKRVVARLLPDWVRGYEGGVIPVVACSNVDGYPTGARLDWGKVQLLTARGVTVVLLPPLVKTYTTLLTSTA